MDAEGYVIQRLIVFYGHDATINFRDKYIQLLMPTAHYHAMNGVIIPPSPYFIYTQQTLHSSKLSQLHIFINKIKNGSGFASNLL